MKTLDTIRSLDKPKGVVIISFSENTIYQTLSHISNMTAGMLEASFYYYNDLPREHMAKYLINNHMNKDDFKIDEPSPYDYGVLLGNELLRKAKINDLPVISEFDQYQRLIIDYYLSESRKTKTKKLFKNYDREYPLLKDGVRSYCDKCSSSLPHTMLSSNSRDELYKGLHDFVSVFSIAESSLEAKEQAVKLALGKFIFIKHF